MKAAAVVFVLLICVGITAVSGGYVWNEELTDSDEFPDPRYHHVMGKLGSHSLLIFGGFDFDNGGVFLNDTWSFNTSSNEWTQHATEDNDTVPPSRAYSTAVSYNNSEVVVFGGAGPNYKIYNDTWRFSRHSKNWTKDTYVNLTASVTSQIARQYHAAAVIGDHMYIFGGHSFLHDRTTNSLLSYNLNTSVWSVLKNDKSPGPAARQGSSLVPFNDSVAGESLILFGGYSENPYNGGFDDTWQYIIAKKAWIPLTSSVKPPLRYSHEGAVLNGTVLIYGGLATYNVTRPPTTDVYYDDVWALEVTGNGAANWTQVLTTSVAGKRQGHQSAVINDVLYTSGGYIPYVGLASDIWSLRVTNTTTHAAKL